MICVIVEALRYSHGRFGSDDFALPHSTQTGVDFAKLSLGQPALCMSLSVVVPFDSPLSYHVHLHLPLYLCIYIYIYISYILCVSLHIRMYP